MNLPLDTHISNRMNDLETNQIEQSRMTGIEIARIVYYPDGKMKHHINIQSIRTNGIIFKKKLDGSWIEHNRIPRGESFLKYIESASPDWCKVKHPEMLHLIPRN